MRLENGVKVVPSGVLPSDVSSHRSVLCREHPICRKAGLMGDAGVVASSPGTA